MEWFSPQTADGAGDPLDQMDFGMVRAIIGARQAASPTCRALVPAGDSETRASGSASEAMRLLAGQGRLVSQISVGGKFAPVEIGQAWRIEGETHA